VLNVTNEEDLSNLRWTLDEPADLEVIRAVFQHFAPGIHFSWNDVLLLSRTHPEIFVANSDISRNEGSSLDTGQKLWKRAKRVIPGGSMLFSKRPELYAPDLWPPYFERASGCYVWDLDGRRFTDVSMMGIGTNILGYGHPQVDAAVSEAVRKGNMSSLNCPEEVILAEKLLQMHPWASRARFARTGGEANSIAIRIARAATGKSKVAVCGYHGWHDWYLSANLADEQNLDGHLLPGLQPSGVPRELKGTVLTFAYNDLDSLVQLFSLHPDISVIKMEVQRSEPPLSGFLAGVRKLADDHSAVLIFDECTSGFREIFGGLHLKYGVFPDIATFGKALGNGYAITAVIGREGVMDFAQSTFISSTFWTERLGPSAALATLDTMEQMRSWENISGRGRKIKEIWQTLADESGIKVNVSGLDALPTLVFVSENSLAYKTLLTQRLLKQNLLASTAFYASTAHSDEIVGDYQIALQPVFQIIRECEDGLAIQDLLDGPIAQSGFARLN
jgi:glutamate-1-semialdehyde 2,1-aminomutase